MSRYYQCDREGCGHFQVEPMPYRLSQLTDDIDEDEDEQLMLTFHFCTTTCLDLFVMAIPRDLEDASTPPESTDI